MKVFQLKQTWFAIIAAFILGFAASYFLTEREIVVETKAEAQNSTSQLREKGSFQFINPLIECDNYQPENNASVANLRAELGTYISGIKADHSVEHISIYYRDLNNGGWIGINEDENYSPASLLKVPIMVCALKKADNDPGFLKKKIKFSRYSDDTTPNIVDTALIKLGNTYTVEELIYKMIANSDNEAKNLILNEVGDDAFTKTFIDAGIAPPNFEYSTDILSTKSYSAFFRVLYNATYLSKEMSEKGLYFLSKASFKQGLVAGVPQGIAVSHKFGERAFADTNIKQLHDCGIVYLNGTPYLLCVMTKGTNFKILEGVIAKVSSIVYSQVSSGS
ncbi:MAG: serine hydrolase [Chitinophagales bacterium]|nr:serine hydrolase [Chitinophagales bacterium]OJV29841.1 MAG: hypothetical protein BGO32_11880 [Bacteroidetes bacterium 37-13]